MSILFVYSLSAQQANDSIPYPVRADTSTPLTLDNGVTYDAVYDSASGLYVLYPKSGSVSVGEPIYLSPQEYTDLLISKSLQDYYKKNNKKHDERYRKEQEQKKEDIGAEKPKEDDDGLLPGLVIRNKWFETIFGGQKIELKPQGYASLDLGIFYQKLDNPQILPQNRSSFAIEMQQRIQMSLLGSVGKNLNMGVNYDTQAGFGFENRLNLSWKGEEDNIVQKLEFGNVSLPLSTTLITGAQALFGAKAELKFGNTYITTVFSQQQSEAKQVTLQGNGLLTDFTIPIPNYDYNQHYYMGQYYRNAYDNALINYPLIQSAINISRIEVWRIDRGNANVESKRQIVALRDLGETTTTPDNGALYNTISNLPGIRDPNTATSAIQNAGLTDATGALYKNGEQYIVHENVRKMESTEYTVHPSLGYISLNQPLDDNELLAVAYQYTINGSQTSYQVGEFSSEESRLLIVKLLKTNAHVDTTSPMWDLMMKNIYSLPGTQVSNEGFLLNVLYQDASAGSTSVNYLIGTNLADRTLLQATNIDRLNIQGDPQINSNNTYGDGLFDFQEGITIQAQKGKLIFPKVEPFGSNLANQLNAEYHEAFVFDDLYRELPGNVLESDLYARYSLKGRFKGEQGSGIPLGAINVPRGSVRVSANGQDLLEGIDYTIDYQLGRLNILNQSLASSGVPINIILENQSAFNLQKKRFLGINVEHKFSNNFIVGGTFVNYNERPLTQKAQYGYEPVNNTMLGINTRFDTESKFLTRLTNKIPFIKTDAPSKINISAEAAYLIPGLNKAVDNESYIDDFDEAQSRIPIGEPSMWNLAATPQNSITDFPTGMSSDLSYNYNRALFSWYTIDPVFFGVGGKPPAGIGNEELSSHMVRRVNMAEIYPGRQITVGNSQIMNTFDITIYPDQKGPYNFNPIAETPQNRWAGISRPLNVTNFTDANIEYIEFWMMDPTLDGDNPNGSLIFQLGNVSEDILRDNNLQYENGLPLDNNSTEGTEATLWGKQPVAAPILYTFDTDGDARAQQDAGLDGLIDNNETSIGNGVIIGNQITGNDPSGDDFVYYLDNRYATSTVSNSVIGRYKYFRGTEGNSNSGTLEASSGIPDIEDANFDGNLDVVERYQELSIPISASDFTVGQNYIVDKREASVTLENGKISTGRWYQYRIPVSDFIDPSIGLHNTDLLNSTRYIRMIMKGFNARTTLRFATLDLVRTDWRGYTKKIAVDNTDTTVEGGSVGVDEPNFNIGVVNLEENVNRKPPYVIPPGIERQEIGGTTGLLGLNEQSIVLTVDDLNHNSAGIFRNTMLDLRRYKQLEMFLHAEDVKNPSLSTNDPNARFFIRLGNDLVNNYYEYEISLQYTPNTAVSATDIWPAANTISFNTDNFVNAKEQRDLQILAGNTGLLSERYTVSVADNSLLVRNVIVKGRPSLGNITSIMMGIRNVSHTDKSIVLWMNELRLSEIENSGGYAAKASVGFNLGDFMQVQATGNYSSIAFGGIDQGPSVRSQKQTQGYNVNTTTNINKFLPEKWGLQIPLSFSYGEFFENPEFNPLDNDVKLAESLERDKIKPIVQTYARQRTIALSNIRKVKTKKQAKPHFYDPENISLSMIFSDSYNSDLYIEGLLRQSLQASVNYNYSFNNKFIQPFKKWRLVKDGEPSKDYLLWFKDFNFNLVPSSISFRADLNRTYNQQKYRDVNSLLLGSTSSLNLLPVIFSNNFNTNWQYNIAFDFTKSLSANITSTTRTLVDEFNNLTADTKMIFQELFTIGRPVSYTQKFQINYDTPIHLFPYLAWTDLDIGYSADYTWAARSTTYLDNINGNLGNIANNGQAWTVNGNLNFDQLFSTLGPYKKLDSIRQSRQAELDAIDSKFEEIEKKQKNGKTSKNKRNVKVNNLKTKLGVKDYLYSAAFALKQVQFNYTQNNGTRLPGLIGNPGFFGTSNLGPTVGFLFGSQEDLRQRMIQNGWIDPNSTYIEPYYVTNGTVFNASALVEPTRNFRIDVNFTRNYNSSLSQNGYNIVNIPNNFIGYLDAFENQFSSFNMTSTPITTTFKTGEEIYAQLKSNAQEISQRLGTVDTDGDGFTDGYGIANANVLLPAFVSAVNGSSANKVAMRFKRDFPMPNWSIQYTGLNNLPFIKKRFSQFNLNHSYASSYIVNGVQSNQSYFNAQNGTGALTDLNGNFWTPMLYNTVNIIESFSPFIGADVTLRNNMQFRFQYNKERLLALNLINYSLAEDYINEFVFGFGYTINNVKFALRYQGNRVRFNGDVNIRADLSIRNSKTLFRRILLDDSQLTGGGDIFSLKINAGYSFSKNFTLSAYYDHQMSSYKISTAYPLTVIRAGINATFTIK